MYVNNVEYEHNILKDFEKFKYQYFLNITYSNS